MLTIINMNYKIVYDGEFYNVLREDGEFVTCYDSKEDADRAVSELTNKDEVLINNHI